MNSLVLFEILIAGHVPVMLPYLYFVAIKFIFNVRANGCELNSSAIFFIIIISLSTSMHHCKFIRKYFI